MLLKDVCVAMSCQHCAICEMAAEPGSRGGFIAAEQSYKNIWEKHLWSSFRFGETSNEKAQTLHGLFSEQCALKLALGIKFRLCPVAGMFEKHVGDRIQGLYCEKALQ